MIPIFNRLLSEKGIAKHPGRDWNTNRAVRFLSFALCVLVIGSLFLSPPPAMAQPAAVQGKALPADGGYVPDEVLVRLSTSTSSVQRKSLGKIGKITASAVSDCLSGLVVLKVANGTVQKAIDELEKQPGVVYAEPNYYVKAQDVIPNDPAFPNQYGLVYIGAPAAWEISKGAAGVTIAIIDTGVDFAQPDLAAKLVVGANILVPDTLPQDDNGHGTMVASVAAAITNNDLGVAGVSWGARIMPVKVLDAGGGGSFLDVATGICFAANNAARVINLSLGGPADPLGLDAQTLCGAVHYAVKAGVVVVVAAGNTYGGGVLFPAACADAVAVTGTDRNNQIAYFSPHGSEIALAAPGVQIIGDGLLGDGRPSLVSEDGTSLSAPFVSGAAAILLGIPGNGFSDDVIRQLETTALDLGAPNRDPLFGFGLLQLDKALQLAVTEHPLPPTSTPTSTFTSTSTFTPSATEPAKKKEKGDGIVGPTDTPEFAGGGAGFGAGGGAGSLTPTLTATSTSTATSTPTMTFTPTDTPTATPGAALVVKPTPPPAAVMPMPPMPWVAGFFLLAGLGLIGYALVLRRGGE